MGAVSCWIAVTMDASVAAGEAARAKQFERSVKCMKKAVLEVQLILLDGVDADAQLRAAGDLLSQAEYGDVVEERRLAKACGYARCGNALSPEGARRGRYRISLSAKKVYDLEESRRFCSPACLIASRDFGEGLPVRRDVVESRESLAATVAAVRGSQYAARSRPARSKDGSAVRPPGGARNAKRGKVRPKDARDRAASPDVPRSAVEDRGQSETVVSSSRSRAWTSGGGDREGASSSGAEIDTGGSSIRPQAGRGNGDVTSPNPSSSLQGTPVSPSTAVSGGSSNDRKLRPEGDSPASASASSTVQTKFEKLTIQERVADQTVLPVFDYGGPSDAIEGYVPSRSRRDALSQAEPRTQSKVPEGANRSDAASKGGQPGDQRFGTGSARKGTGEGGTIALREEVEKPGGPRRSQQDGGRVRREWEGLVSGSPGAGRARPCITEVDGETEFSGSAPESGGDCAPSSSKGVEGNSADLKPALKKQSKAKQAVRSVAWADQNSSEATSRIGKTEPKDGASSTHGTPTSEKSSDDLDAVEQRGSCAKLEEGKRPEAGSSDSSLDSAMAARLASAEAMATALTEAATSAANGECDGSEAAAQAGVSILSATHNASTATPVRPHEARVQSGALDDDELFARAAQAREEMRRSKMPRKYSRLQDEEDGYEDGDGGHDFSPAANGDDDDSDDDVAADDGGSDEDDGDGDDNSGGFEGAHEVGFTAPPKGFKAEVSVFGTVFMALEGWMSAAAVAHIYGKGPEEEDGYLCVNGREYSRQTVMGEGVSAEILRTFSLCVSRALPEVVRALRISVPLSTLELSLGRLIKTISFVEALPPFGTKQWRMLAILLLDALSVERVPRLGGHFSNNRSMMRKVLDSTGTSEAEYDVYRDVVLPLGRSATFSTLSGG